ncbi:MAG: DUF3885 domain-containing protein [Janthinobacterium lividum]
MTAEQFEEFWHLTYPATVPLSELFRIGYPDRWLRIHSLPNSKRYPETALDFSILLHRQNTLITDLLDSELALLLITGEYDFEPNKYKKWQFSPEGSIKNLGFIELKPVELDKLEPDPRTPDENKNGELYRLVLAEVDWQPGVWNLLLKEIAQCEMRAYFISVIKECIIVPYDGGMDIIFKDEATRNYYKAKYQKWLSIREDGL